MGPYISGGGGVNYLGLAGLHDSGNSFILKPLTEVFRDLAFTRPVAKASDYPLQDLFGKKAVLLQNLRITAYTLPFDALLV